MPAAGHELVLDDRAPARPGPRAMSEVAAASATCELGSARCRVEHRARPPRPRGRRGPRSRRAAPGRGRSAVWRPTSAPASWGPSDLAQRRGGSRRHRGVVVRLEQRDEQRVPRPARRRYRTGGRPRCAPGGAPSSSAHEQGVRDAVAHAHQCLGRVAEVHAVAAQRVQQRARGRAGRRPARPCARPGDRTRRERSSRPWIATSSPSTSRQQPMRCSPRTRRDGERAAAPGAPRRGARPARGAARPAVRRAHRGPCRAAARRGRPGRAGCGRSRAEAAQGLAVLAVLAGRDADDERAQRREPALGGALAQAALDLDPDDGHRHDHAGHARSRPRRG